MAAEGRSLIFPKDFLAFGARPLDVPGRGAVLCASTCFAFRLADGEPVLPTDWHQAVAQHGGANAIPDAMMPLPGAEVLVVGPLAPIVEARPAHVRCGSAKHRLELRPDPEADPEAPFLGGSDVALWHEEDNPGGRGGPDDDRQPLIVDAEAPARPIWLGGTPFDHPTRLRRMGNFEGRTEVGWPDDADASALHDAHEAFWAEALHPGEPLEFAGLSEQDIATNLPRYRVSIASLRDQGEWYAETTRIHAVTAIPAAGLAAVFYRAAIELGDDLLGEKVPALVAALEDADTPPKDGEHWGTIAVDRWVDPVKALDDRVLLPAALAATVALPFAKPPGGDPIQERVAAAEAWMRKEGGLPETNPFADRVPKEAEVADRMEEAVGDEEKGPDVNAAGALAEAALAAGRRKHEQAGFKRPDGETQPPREPEVRGHRLDAEVQSRLSAPYRARSEATIATQLRRNPVENIDPDEVLGRMAKVRIISPRAALPWPALDEEEGVRFGAALADRLAAGGVGEHIDVAGAIVEGGNVFDADTAAEPAGQQMRFAGLRLADVLAEETVWRGILFEDCEFVASSFAGARFENCEFRNCTFEGVNLSRATVSYGRFADCRLRDLQLVDPAWTDCEWRGCELTRVSMTDPAMRAVAFYGGAWEEVQFIEGLMIEVALRGTRMFEVTYTNTHAPYSRFEGLSMHKVWGMAKGFPGSVFEEVEAKTCGFLSMFHFDEARFSRTRFVDTGFTNAVFKDAKFAPYCQFQNCDLTGAAFDSTELARVRFLHCTMAMTFWANVEAVEAWFFGSILRAVDFADTQLAGAVFVDADIDGASFQADKTIGADFRGALGAPS